MKILYVGDGDCLAVSILESLKKEDNDVFLLGERKEGGTNKIGKYHHFAWSDREGDIKRVFTSVVPDVVIYAGVGYLDAKWEEGQRENLNRLSLILEECKQLKTCKFILLSSLEVCRLGGADEEEQSVGKAGEAYPSQKGILMLQEEKITEIYHGNMGLEIVILRISELFSDKIVVGAGDWLGSLAGELKTLGKLVLEEKLLQPVHILDAADAVTRAAVGESDGIYNICSTMQLAKSEIAEWLAREMGLSVSIKTEKNARKALYISNSRIKEEKEWTEFWTWDKMLQQKRFVCTYEQKTVGKKIQKKRNAKNGVRKTIENIVIFALFCLIFFITQKHSLFSKASWLSVYVVVVALTYGIRQSTLAVVLASGAELLAQGTNILEMTNFYSYAESVLQIVQFLFLGIVVGYSVDMLREEVRSCKSDWKRLQDSYEKLQVINDRNVFIKNEYEKRVLEAKTSLPRLYSIINRITVLDMDRIFMEILYVVKELMGTETAAVYRVSQESSYLRLIASLNKESVMEGNSWDLSSYPHIEQAIRGNKLYEGDIWKKEPAIVLPAGAFDVCRAVLVIKKLPFEAQSLYSLNLLRTLLLLISDSIEKALQYDTLMREKRYHKNTNILYPEEFRKAVTLAEEKKQKKIAESCILRVWSEEDMQSTYDKAERLFRETDIWGSDEEGNLYVLLGNTAETDTLPVWERLRKSNIAVEKQEGFQ